jgi:hypothetical protein
VPLLGTWTRRPLVATKLDLSFGTPILGIIEKAMDIWLAVYQAAPQEEKAELARQIIQRSIVWEGFVNRILERMLGGEE